MNAATSVEACGYCQGVLDANSTVAECSTCGIKQHRECWDEYGGCVLPGCTGQDKNRPVPEQQAQLVQIVVPADGAPVAAAPQVLMQPPAPTSGKSIAVLVVAAVIILAALVAAGVLLAMQ